MGSAVALHEVVGSINVLTCVADLQLCARLRDGLRDRGVLRVVPSLTALIAALRSSPESTDVVVLPPRDPTGRDAPSVVREIAASFPQIAVVAYCSHGVEYSADIRALALAGVHQFLFSGEDTRVSVQAVFDGARRGCAAERVMASLARVLPAKVHPIAEACLNHPASIVTVAQLASATGLHRKTLYNQCVQAGAPSPAELITWCRLSLVAYMLVRSGRTVESIADELEFPSVTALRNVIKRYTGLRAKEIRASGGIERVITALSSKMATLRPALHVV